jgi:hypothetical protein
MNKNVSKLNKVNERAVKKKRASEENVKELAVFVLGIFICRQKWLSSIGTRTKSGDHPWKI